MSEQKIRNHAAVQRVTAVLAAAGLDERVVVLPDTARTAEDAAAGLAVPVGAIVKSLVFVAAGAPVLVLASGDHRVDVDVVAQSVGATLERAEAKSVRDVTGMSIGGVAPIGHLTVLPVYVDEHLGDFAVVWAAAGHPHAVWPTNLAELLQLTGGRSIAVHA